MQPVDVTASDANGNHRALSLDGYPDACPVCHAHVKPIVIAFTYLSGKDMAQGIFRCTNTRCDEVFVTTYGGARNGMRTMQRSEPFRFVQYSFSKEITAASPAFCQIYNQAIAAEAASLDQMVGIGLRKALEFLIKDFAISEKPEKAVEIKAAFLGNVIKQYIDDRRVQALAERATWLGNDETHYVRKWESKDITDLKNLVTLTLNAIQNAILGKQYLQDMAPPQKS